MAKPKKWVRNVKTVSTSPPKDLFKKDAQTIARTMARKSVSPRGIGSGIRMIQYFINRAGKSLSITQAQIGESEEDPATKEKIDQEKERVAYDNYEIVRGNPIRNPKIGCREDRFSGGSSK